MAEMDFAMFVNGELDRRGWSRSEAARRGGISASMLDKVISGNARPGYRTCKGIARAFNLPIDEVLRMAGILPNVGRTPLIVHDTRAEYRSVTDEERERLLWAFKQLSPADRELALDLVERLAGMLRPRIVG